MSWSTELRRKYPDLPVKPNGISDADWETFVGVWNGDTLKVAGEKRGLGYNRLSRVFFLVRMRLPPPRKGCADGNSE